MPRKKGASRNPPGVLCFSLSGSGHVKKRARYEPEQKKEVAQVRAVGACLRCQLMKMPCSGGRPCSRCAQAIFSSQASSRLWLLPCVPSALAGLKNFFKADVPIDNGKILSALDNHKNLELLYFSVNLDYKLEWDLAALSPDWPICVLLAIKFRILSSFWFQEFMSPLVSSKLGSCFRLMMRIWFLIYMIGTRDSYFGLSLEDVYALRSYAGTHFFMELERLLRPTELASASSEKIRATFFLLLGAIIAVTDYERVRDDTAARLRLHDSAQRASFREFSQHQEQLVRVLTYRLTDIADRLGLLESGVSKQRLVDSAKQQWHLPANFVWQDLLFPLLSSIVVMSYEFSSHRRLFGEPLKQPLALKVIMEQDSFLPLPVPAELYTPTCQKCGIVLPDGLPDPLCYTCAFVNWDLFESEEMDFSPN